MFDDEMEDWLRRRTESHQSTFLGLGERWTSFWRERCRVSSNNWHVSRSVLIHQVLIRCRHSAALSQQPFERSPDWLRREGDS